MTCLIGKFQQCFFIIVNIIFFIFSWYLKCTRFGGIANAPFSPQSGQLVTADGLRDASARDIVPLTRGAHPCGDEADWLDGGVWRIPGNAISSLSSDSLVIVTKVSCLSSVFCCQLALISSEKSCLDVERAEKPGARPRVGPPEPDFSFPWAESTGS